VYRICYGLGEFLVCPIPLYHFKWFLVSFLRMYKYSSCGVFLNFSLLYECMARVLFLNFSLHMVVLAFKTKFVSKIGYSKCANPFLPKYL
jgi:hypothetical protein